jgi:ABC-type multidrug transport system fused ATPase/permease subunit
LAFERFNTDVRLRIEAMLREALQGEYVDSHVVLGDSPLAQVHLIVRPMAGGSLEPDTGDLEKRLANVLRNWQDDLREALIARHGETEGLRIASDLWLGGKAEVSDVTTLLGIYVLLGAGSLACIMAVRVINYKLGLKLAWTLFDGMLGRISRAPMAFFDKVPQGRILNRFDRDLGEAQEVLLSMLMGLFGMLVSVLLQVVVIGINERQLKFLRQQLQSKV